MAPRSQELPASLEDRKKQMAQLAEMGVEIPNEFRADMALAGDWKVVSERVIEDEETKQLKKDASTFGAVGVRKRKHGEQGDGSGEEEEEDGNPGPAHLSSKTWGSVMKEYPDRPGNEDLDALLESTREIKAKPSTTTANVKAEEGETARESQLKREENEDPSTAAKNPPKEAAPEVVFKKRKPKAMRK